MKELKLAILAGHVIPELADGIIRRIDALPVTEICLIDEDGINSASSNSSVSE